MSHWSKLDRKLIWGSSGFFFFRPPAKKEVTEECDGSGDFALFLIQYSSRKEATSRNRTMQRSAKYLRMAQKASGFEVDKSALWCVFFPPSFLFFPSLLLSSLEYERRKRWGSQGEDHHLQLWMNMKLTLLLLLSSSNIQLASNICSNNAERSRAPADA